MFGLKDSDLVIIREVLKGFPEIEEAVLYGSRAKGNHKTGSDVDLALKGSDTARAVTSIWGILNDESPLPYFFDVLSYEQISNPDLKEHIDRVGISIYSRSKE